MGKWDIFFIFLKTLLIFTSLLNFPTGLLKRHLIRWTGHYWLDSIFHLHSSIKFSFSTPIAKVRVKGSLFEETTCTHLSCLKDSLTLHSRCPLHFLCIRYLGINLTAFPNFWYDSNYSPLLL